MFQGEFRLHGTISDDPVKSIKYTDLCKQINDGRRKGYSEDDLLSGLKRGIVAGSVKTYMDAWMDMTLSDALEFLRSHLKELPPSDLMTLLSGLAQGSDKTAKEFLLEALQLRQTLQASSHSSDAGMAQSVFIQSLRTGIRNEHIRHHMLPFLDETKAVPDNVLVKEMDRAVAEEEQRVRKLLTAAGGVEKKRVAQSNAVAMMMEDPLAERLQKLLVAGGGVEKKIPAQANAVGMDDPLAVIMKQLKANETKMDTIQQDNKHQMKVMQEQIAELMKMDTDSKKPSWKKLGCEDCIANNRSAQCNHCWKCGKTGHKSRDNKCASN